MNSQFQASLLVMSATVSLPLLFVAPASAVTVTVGFVNYDVNVFIGKYLGNESLFQIPPAGQMTWWGDGTGDLAAEFAEQVIDQLGSGPSTGYGPVFAYELSGTDILGISQNLTNPDSQKDETIANNSDVKYAIVTPLQSDPLSVPAPLPVFGAAAALGWSRQLRKRIGASQR